MFEAAAWLAAFVLGSFPTAYVWTRVRTGKDIRTLGSGNVGATNVLRSVGKMDGIAVLAVDALKGIAGVWIGFWIWSRSGRPPQGLEEDLLLIKFVLGCGAILGHVFSPWLKFKGGKGVATGAGVALAVYPIPLFLAFVVWSVILKVTRYMSLASIIGAYIFAISTAMLVPGKTHAAIAFAAAVFITWTHRSNIDRLLKGSENKLFHK